MSYDEATVYRQECACLRTLLEEQTARADRVQQQSEHILEQWRQRGKMMDDLTAKLAAVEQDVKDREDEIFRLRDLEGVPQCWKVEHMNLEQQLAAVTQERNEYLRQREQVAAWRRADEQMIKGHTEQLAAVQAEVRRLLETLDQGKLWSFIRRILSQGADIMLDYNAGKYIGYEMYSARLDAAARERTDEFIEQRIKELS